ncbi:MAG: BCCT family transporter [Bacteroidales bacterium]|nr:BCCT family transporter [Bacteroidales bacterium]
MVCHAFQCRNGYRYILFWSVGEPIVSFYQTHPVEKAAPVEAARLAMETTFLHWGMHPWGIYALVGMAISVLHL